MTEIEFSAAADNEATRAFIDQGLATIPDLGEASISPYDFSNALANLSAATLGAADARVADQIAGQCTSCYALIRTTLSNLKTTLLTEFEAI